MKSVKQCCCLPVITDMSVEEAGQGGRRVGRECESEIFMHLFDIYCYFKYLLEAMCQRKIFISMLCTNNQD